MHFIFCLLTLLFSTLYATELNVIEKQITVNNKAASIYAIAQPDGTLGVRISKNQPFDVQLNNHLNVPTSVHWHGLILPNNQDGVASITQLPVYPGQTYPYNFPLVQSGTFWMHSHYGLQEQKLLSAPLIIYDPDDSKIADQEVVVFLSDFSFTPPSTIMDNLRCQHASNAANGKMHMHGPDVVEVNYDAYLANYRTLKSPDIIEVKPRTKVRLRIINASSATNFFINLPDIPGEAIAVDGNRIIPLQGSQFELAVAQRIDIVVTIPEKGGAFPILAQAEGTDRQTGLVLSTKDAKMPVLSEKAAKNAGPLTNAQERKMQALHPLPDKKVDNHLIAELGGNMADYVWTINGQAWPESTPLMVEKGQRVELLFKNTSTMSHPMHLHGHVFQVKAINGQVFEGALRDTVLVMPNSTLAIQFDADNPGVWPMHCHILYHLESGMLTVVRYADFQQFIKME